MPSEIINNTPVPNAFPVASSEPLGVLRALIPVSDAGLIIGKSGQNIQQIRDQSSAKIRLSEFISGSQERIVSVTGTPKQVAQAFSLISQIDPQHLKVLYFLIPHTQMGAVIGKAGSKIRELQQVSHCKLVASEQLLPNSTERWVCVTSHTPQDLYTCVELLAELLAQMQPQKTGDISEPHFDRGYVAYKPISGASSVFQNNGRRQRGGVTGGGKSAQGLVQTRQGKPIKSPHSPEHQNATSFEQEDRDEQLINIPNDLVGAIIGKGGVQISEIRKVSGAQIRILDAIAGQETRVASVSGSRQAIAIALNLICKKMESERKALESQ